MRQLIEFAESHKEGGDALSLGTLALWFANLLPHIATLLTVVWMALRIYQLVRDIRKGP